MAKTAGELLRELRELKDSKDKLNEQLAEVNKSIQAIEMGSLPELMIEAGLELGAKVAEKGIGTATLDVRVMPSVLAANREAFHDWLEANGHNIVKREVHHKTLEKWCREMLEVGEEPPEELIKITTRNVVKFRR